ncbi:MAG: phage tail length tape measure family protein [Sterolibacterium sp.]|nr:phage tail length tape measure family protein [Sterolibacterium sp.]
MSNVPLGITITTNGRVAAVAEVNQVDDSLKRVGTTAKQTTVDLNQTRQQVDNMALSTKQLNFALRGVPAQFTDIATSLAAGQNPMQVFLQQGGQLKDMFGGAGNAARALGSYVVGLINPFTVGAAAVGTLAAAYEMGRRESEAMARAIILSGNAAGATAAQMQGISRAVSAASGATRGAVADVVSQLVATAKVGAESLQNITDTAIRLERAGGPAIEDTVKAFAELGKSPVEASFKLNEQTNYLTGSIYLQIKALDEQGKSAEAAALAQKAYADAMQKRVPQLEENLGTLERAWRGVKDGAKGAWDAMLGVGRKEDPVTQIKKDLADAEWRLADTRKNRDYNPQGARAEEFRLQNIIAGLNAQLAVETKIAAQKKEQAAAQDKDNDNLIQTKKWRDEIDKSQTHQVEQLRVQLDLVKQLKPTTSNEAADQKQRELEINKQIESIQRNMGSESRARTEEEISYQQKLSEITLKSGVDEIETQYKLGKITLQRRDELLSDNALELNFSKQLYEEQMANVAGLTKAEKQRHIDKLNELQVEGAADAKKGTNKVLIDEKNLRDEILKNINATGATEISALEKTIAAQRLHNAEIGKTAEQKMLEKQAIEEAGTRQLKIDAEEFANAATMEGVNEVYRAALAARAEQLRIEIGLRRQLAGLMGDAAVKEAAAAANKQFLDGWKHGADEFERIFSDALMHGFDNGKEFGQDFIDSLEHSLKTAGLKIGVKMVLDPISGSIQGAITGQNPAAAMGLFGNTGSLINTLSAGGSLYNFATGNVGAGMYGSFATSSIGSSLGLSTPGLMGPTVTGEALSGLTTFGTALPYIGAAIAAISLASSLFGGGGGQKVGGDATYQDGKITDWAWGAQGRSAFTETQTNAAMAEAMDSFAKGVSATIAKLGGKLATDLAVSFGQAADPAGDGPDRVASQVRRGASVLYEHSQDVARGTGPQELGTEMNRLMVAALKESDMPAWADAITYTGRHSGWACALSC